MHSILQLEVGHRKFGTKNKHIDIYILGSACAPEPPVKDSDSTSQLGCTNCTNFRSRLYGSLLTSNAVCLRLPLHVISIEECAYLAISFSSVHLDGQKLFERAERQ